MIRLCKRCQSETERYASGRCKPCTQANAAKWIDENRDKARASRAKWREANKEKQKIYADAWRVANPEKRRAGYAARRANNPEALRILNHNRRARKREVGGRLSNDLVARLLNLQRGKCACCKTALGNKFHRDHHMPLALGGTNTDDNMQLLCPKCNMQKGAKHPIEFMQRKGFLL